MSKHLILAQGLLLVLRALRDDVGSDESDTTLHIEQRETTQLNAEVAPEGPQKTGDVSFENQSHVVVDDDNCVQLRRTFPDLDFMVRMYVNTLAGQRVPFAFEGLILKSILIFTLEQTKDALTLHINDGSQIEFNLLGSSLILPGLTEFRSKSMSGTIKVEKCKMIVVIAGNAESKIECDIPDFKMETQVDSSPIEYLTPTAMVKSVFLETLRQTIKAILQNLITGEFRDFLAANELVKKFKANGQVHVNFNDHVVEVESQGIVFDFSLTSKGFTQLHKKIEDMKLQIAQIIEGSSENSMLDSVSVFLNDWLGRKLVATTSLEINKEIEIDGETRNDGETEADGERKIDGETETDGVDFLPRVSHSGRLIIGGGKAKLAEGCKKQLEGECFEQAESMPLAGIFVVEMLRASLTHFGKIHSLPEEALDGKNEWKQCKYYALKSGFPIAIAQLGNQLLRSLETIRELLEKAEKLKKRLEDGTISLETPEIFNMDEETRALSEMTLVAKADVELIMNRNSENQIVHVNLKVSNFRNALKLPANGAKIYTLAPPGVLV